MSIATLTNSVKFTFNLPALRHLSLAGNKFSSTLPMYRAFGLLPKLCFLDLSSNQIRHVDAEMSHEDSVASSMSFGSLDQDLGEKRKILSQAKYLMYELKTVDLSHNQMEFGQGGFVRMLCDISRLAPNLSGFVFDQKFGHKLREDGCEVDEEFCFQFEDGMRSLEVGLVRGLRTIDLSNNGLSKVPGFVFKLESLREICFNGNCLKRIPGEMYQVKCLDFFFYAVVKNTCLLCFFWLLRLSDFFY